MGQVGRVGAENVYGIGSTMNERTGPSLFDFSNPSGWVMLWWFLAILVLAFIYFSL